MNSSDNIYLAGSAWSYWAGGWDMVLVKYVDISEPSDNVVPIVIIIVPIVSVVGVGIAITFFIRKRRKNLS